jgi:hypothetical protein
MEENGIGQDEEKRRLWLATLPTPILVSFCEPNFLAFHATFG